MNQVHIASIMFLSNGIGAIMYIIAAHPHFSNIRHHKLHLKIYSPTEYHQLTA